MLWSSKVWDLDNTPTSKHAWVNVQAQRLLKKGMSFVRLESGGVAVEFTLLAPILIAALLFMGIASSALARFIEIEQMVHAGAEAAIRDPGVPEVLARMRAAAIAKGYVVAEPPVPVDQVFFTATRSCSCPEDLNMGTSCNALCQGGRPTIAQYRVTGIYTSGFQNAMREALAALGIGSAARQIRIIKHVVIR